MTKTCIGALSSMAILALVLTGCVGAPSVADPERHPDAAKRQQMRHFYDHKYRRG